MRLTQTERIRYNAGIEILKIASTARTLVRKPILTSKTSSLSKEVGKAVNAYLRKHPSHIIYGSLAARQQMFKSRVAKDVDLAIDNPERVARELQQILRKYSNKQTRIISSPGKNRYAVQVKIGEEWSDVFDIHKAGIFYGEYIQGQTLDPYKQKDGLRIQKLLDQLLRKGNSVLAYDVKEKRFGPKPERAEKDTVDFVNVSKMLIASKLVRAKATLARVKEAEKAIKVWENYVKQLKDYGTKYKVHPKHISKERENKFIKYAIENPTIPVKDLVFTNGRVKHIPRTKQKPIVRRKKIVSPYYDVPSKRVKQTEIEQLLGLELEVSSPIFEMGGVKIKTKYPSLKIE